MKVIYIFISFIFLLKLNGQNTDTIVFRLDINNCKYCNLIDFNQFKYAYIKLETNAKNKIELEENFKSFNLADKIVFNDSIDNKSLFKLTNCSLDLETNELSILTNFSKINFFLSEKYVKPNKIGNIKNSEIKIINSNDIIIIKKNEYSKYNKVTIKNPSENMLFDSIFNFYKVDSFEKIFKASNMPKYTIENYALDGNSCIIRFNIPEILQEDKVSINAKYFLYDLLTSRLIALNLFEYKSHFFAPNIFNNFYFSNDTLHIGINKYKNKIGEYNFSTDNYVFGKFVNLNNNFIPIEIDKNLTYSREDILDNYYQYPSGVLFDYYANNKFLLFITKRTKTLYNLNTKKNINLPDKNSVQFIFNEKIILYSNQSNEKQIKYIDVNKNDLLIKILSLNEKSKDVSFSFLYTIDIINGKSSIFLMKNDNLGFFISDSPIYSF